MKTIIAFVSVILVALLALSAIIGFSGIIPEESTTQVEETTELEETTEEDVKMISFTVNGISYVAEEGATWRDVITQYDDFAITLDKEIFEKRAKGTAITIITNIKSPIFFISSPQLCAPIFYKNICGISYNKVVGFCQCYTIGKRYNI